MKLIFCPKCQDVVRLQRTVRLCECGKSGGHYAASEVHAVFYGEAVPLGFDNRSFASAVCHQPMTGKGLEFKAFVIPQLCSTFKRINDVKLYKNTKR